MNKKTTVNPYLNFNGKAREALAFYKEALSGRVEMTTFGESPIETDEVYKDRIIHATLYVDDGQIMASDGMPGEEVLHGNVVSLSLNTDDLTKAERWFSNLAGGGTILMPFSKTFWGAQFGMLKDRFGIQWMINCQVDGNNYV